MVSPGDRAILEDKKAKFLSEVKKSADYLGYPAPKVIFHKEYDANHFTRGERAHIHIEERTICISEEELKLMDYDEITETASHEVTHLRHKDHDANFFNTRIDVETETWSPPGGGTVHIRGSHPPSKERKEAKRKPVKFMCNYHLCRKRGKTYKCKYCGNYFCKKHLQPKAMTMFLGNDSSPRAQLLMDEYRKENAHPCPPYNNYLEGKKKKEKDEYGETLDNLFGKHTKYKDYNSKKVVYAPSKKEDYLEKTEEAQQERDIHSEAIKRIKERGDLNEEESSNLNEEEIAYMKEAGNYHKKRKIPFINLKTIIILIIILLFLLSWKTGWISSINDKARDSFIGNSFLNGLFPSKYENKSSAYQSFNSLNTRRKDKGDPEIKWDSKLYSLAVLNSKLLYQNQTSSTTKNIISIKLKSDENSNPLGIEWQTLGYQIHIKASLELVDYQKYSDGAIGCYKYYCSFIGLIPQKIQNLQDTPYSNVNSQKEQRAEDYDYSNDRIRSPLKPDIDIYSLELEIHNLINIERQNNGLNTLSLDSKLSDVARDHSIDMAQNNFFEHDNLNGQDPTDRANAQGYSCYKNFGSYYTKGLAENIFQNNLYDSITYLNGIPFHDWNSQSEIAQSTVLGWMNSPGHRQNILTSGYDKEGIGVAISSDDEVYITQDFC